MELLQSLRILVVSCGQIVQPVLKLRKRCIYVIETLLQLGIEISRQLGYLGLEVQILLSDVFESLASPLKLSFTDQSSLEDLVKPPLILSLPLLQALDVHLALSSGSEDLAPQFAHLVLENNSNLRLIVVGSKDVLEFVDSSKHLIVHHGHLCPSLLLSLYLGIHLLHQLVDVLPCPGLHTKQV